MALTTQPIIYLIRQNNVSKTITGGVFIVILVGIGLAFITLIFEYWYYKNRDPDPRMNNAHSMPKQIDVKQFAGDKSAIDREADSALAYRFDFSDPIAWVCFQCNQIGRFVAFWATFQSLWYQLFCPNCSQFRQFL